MKVLAQASVVFALLLSGPHGGAQAGTVYHPQFTLDYGSPADHLAGDIPDLLLLSDVDGATTFTLPRFEWFQSEYSTTEDFYELVMRILPQPGYQVVRYELTGRVTGTLWAEQPPDTVEVYSMTPAEPHNYALFGFGPHVYIRDFNTTHDISLALASGATTYDYVDLLIASNAFRHLGWYSVAYPGDERLRLEAAATVEYSDLRLTIHTAPIPVPEPRMWALLLLGVAPLPLVLRRSSRPVRPSS